MLSQVEQIRLELKAIENWDRQFPPSLLLDEIGMECRRIRKEQLLRELAELSSKN